MYVIIAVKLIDPIFQNSSQILEISGKMVKKKYYCSGEGHAESYHLASHLISLSLSFRSEHR